MEEFYERAPNDTVSAVVTTERVVKMKLLLLQPVSLVFVYFPLTVICTV